MYVLVLIEGQIIHVQLLVITNLIKPVLFETDFLTLTNMEINFSTNTIIIHIMINLLHYSLIR